MYVLTLQQTSRIFKYAHRVHLQVLAPSSVDAVSLENTVPTAVEVCISSCAALNEKKCKRHNALCTMAGIVERIGKRKSLMFWLRRSRPCVMQMLHTSSVNLLFLPESREAGVSLLANAAV
jgi:hypothetical protein